MPTYKEQQILDKVCKVTRQKQIKYYDFIPFFDFQYEKIIFNCQLSHFSPCSAVPDNPVTFTRDSGCQARDEHLFIREGYHILSFFLSLGTVLQWAISNRELIRINVRLTF